MLDDIIQRVANLITADITDPMRREIDDLVRHLEDLRGRTIVMVDESPAPVAAEYEPLPFDAQTFTPAPIPPVAAAVDGSGALQVNGRVAALEPIAGLTASEE
jgi:hypothetical protein